MPRHLSCVVSMQKPLVCFQLNLLWKADDFDDIISFVFFTILIIATVKMGGNMVRPDEVKVKAQRLGEQNYKFRAFLKNRADRDELDAKFLKLHNEMFAVFDCCKCTNCCKAFSIILDNGEIKKIAASLGMIENDFITEYLANADLDDEKPYKIKEMPCSFLLSDGRCRIQDCKPDVCAEFPFTNQPDRLLRLYSIIGHAEICPVVFEMLERLKGMYGFRNWVRK